MTSGIFNLVVGLLMVAGGLSGRFTFIFTDSSNLLAVLGAGIALLGAYQIAKTRRR